MLDNLRLEEMEVGVSLPVGVAHHIDRHSVYGDANVGTVVEVEASEEHLLRLASSGVLRDKEARDSPKHLLRRLYGIYGEVDFRDLAQMVDTGDDIHIAERHLRERVVFRQPRVRVMGESIVRH